MRIHEALKSGVRANASILAAKFEVSSKTVLRDIAFMRDRLDLPVEYDPRICAFRYTESVDNFPTVQITEGELLSLLVAQKALEQYKGTPYHHQLQTAFQKLTASMRDKVSFTPATNRATVSFHNVGPGKADLKIFERISRAVAESLEVDLDYKKPKSQATERRRVRPYHLANRDNFWYLVGHDLERNSLRNFAVARIESVKVTAIPPTGGFTARRLPADNPCARGDDCQVLLCLIDVAVLNKKIMELTVPIPLKIQSPISN